MFWPLEMRRVSLRVLREDADTAALVLGQTASFHPDVAEAPEGALSEHPSSRYARVHASACSRLARIEHALGTEHRATRESPRVVGLAELEALDEELGAIRREVFDIDDRLRALLEEAASLRATRESLARFAALDVDLGRLRRGGRFLSVHVGTVPTGNRRQLDEAAALAEHFAWTFHVARDVEYVVVAGPAENGEEVVRLLQAADFRPLAVPAAFRDRPEHMDRELAEHLARVEGDAARERARLAAAGNRHASALARAWTVLGFAAPYATLGSLLVARGGLAVLEGWVPADRLPEVERALSAGLERPFELVAREPAPEERGRVPCVMRHRGWLDPFASLVRNYGLPRYREVDPTVLMGVTFVLLFGTMFGDVGQGLVLAIGGWLARRRWRGPGIFLVAAGSASFVFGFVYGSVFGYEHVIEPLWIAPLSDPQRMLGVAILCGIAFILLVNVITVINLIAESRPVAALLAPRGVAGSVAYLAGVAAIDGWLARGVVPAWAPATLAVSLAAMLVHAWGEHRAPVGERVVLTAVEGFETLLGYLANTLSFLRVAAFSLNHVALAIAVFTIAEGLDRTGHVAVVVLGNVAMIVLEGAIVTIQILRLEYYEGFSRFFRGDGRPFEPLRLSASAA